MAGQVPLRRGAGQRRQRVDLQKGVPVTDETGGASETWPVFGQDWAAIEPVPFVVDETKAAVLFTVAIRYRQDLVDLDDIGTQIRVVGAGKTLKMLALVNPEERNRDLILHCGRVTDTN